jgi:hypothetical protein
MAMTLQQSRLRLTQAIYFGEPPAGTPVLTAYVKRDGSTPLTATWNAGNFQIKSQNSTGWLNVVAYGADPTGATISTNAIISALAAAGVGATIYFPRGTYKIDQQITIANAGVTLTGDGQGQTVIDFEPGPPPGPKVCFLFSAGASTLNNCGISGMTFLSSDVGTSKTGIKVLDAVNFDGHGITFSGTWTGASSIAIYIAGRQEVRFRDMAINSADFPVVIGVNPNSYLCFDHSSIESSELVVTAALTNAPLTINDGVHLSNAAFEHLALVKGGPGISYNNTTLATALQNIVINDVRAEQPADAAAYAIDFRSSLAEIQSLVIMNSKLESGRNGIRLTNAKYGTIENVLYDGTGTAWNLSATCKNITFIECFRQAGSSITDSSVSPTMIGQIVGANPAVAGFNALTTAVPFTVNDKMMVGGTANASGCEVDIFHNATYTLENSGGMYFRTGAGATNTGLLIGTDKANNTAYLQSIEPSTGFGLKPLSLQPNGGNVGFKTITPSREIDLNGTQRWRGIAPPAVSEANSATVYFDSAANKLKASLNGSAYVDVIGSGGLTGSGAANKIAYFDAPTNVAAPLVYVDPATNALGIKVASPSYSLDVDGDANISAGHTYRIDSFSVLDDNAATGYLSVGSTHGTLVASDTAIGQGTLASSSGAGTGVNTAVGTQALGSLTTGHKNVALGAVAGNTITTGSNNVLLGTEADTTANNLTNAVAIGYQASVAANDSMSLGNSSMKVGIRTSTPGLALDVNGAVAHRMGSIATLVNGLNSNITTPDASFVRLSGPTGAFSVGGFTGGTSGRLLTIYNTVAFQMTIVNEDAGTATVTNRIKTLTGANVVLRAGTSSASFIYDDSDDRWILVGSN